MRRILLQGLGLVPLLLAGATLGSGAADESPPAEEEAAPGGVKEVIVTLEVPLGSPLFSSTPVALVNEDPITFSELMKGIASSHAGRTEQQTDVKKNYAKLLERLITTKLIVQEARNIGLDELEQVKSEIDKFSSDLLISTLMSRALRGVEPPAAEVEKLYRETAREFLLRTVKFRKEEDALAFERELAAGGGFEDLARRFGQEGRSEGGLEAGEHVKLKDLLPGVAQTVQSMEVGSVSPIFRTGEAFLLFRVEDVRFYEDAVLKREARQRILNRMKRQKAREYGDSLEAQYAVVDEELLKEMNLEPRGTGFWWFGQAQPLDYEALLADERVVARVRGDETFTVTVSDLAEKLQSGLFHGLERGYEDGQDLNRRKATTLRNILFKKIAGMEAARQGLDRADEYLDAVREHRESVLFGMFVKKAVVPDVEISGEEMQRYYEAHLEDFSTPKMLRMTGLAFYARANAESALKKLERGADFQWVSANTPGQVDRDTRGVMVFDDSLLSLTALPEDLQPIAEKARTGDALLYSSHEDCHYVIAVSKVFPPKPEVFAVVRDEIWNILAAQKVEELVREWGSRLREEYDTRIFVTGLGD